MIPLEALLDLARRLEKCEQPAAATRLRAASLSLGAELVPLFELLVEAIEARGQAAAEALAWMEAARPGEAAPWADFEAARERVRAAADPRCDWCCSADHPTEACADRRRKAVRS